jgi:hypothetical protein
MRVNSVLTAGCWDGAVQMQQCVETRRFLSCNRHLNFLIFLQLLFIPCLIETACIASNRIDGSRIQIGTKQE